MDILVIGDSHAKPDVSSERASWAARLAIDRKPSIIVDIGDRGNIDSLCSYDEGKIQSEGRRYTEDVEAVLSWNQSFQKPIEEFNSQWIYGKKKYRPEKFFCVGNHENRITRAAQDSPRLHGTISIDDLKMTEYGWYTIPYLKPLILHGITFQHYFPSGVMMRAIGGEHHAASLVKKGYASCVCGHSHERDFWETGTNQGKKVAGLVTGCYMEHDEEYTTECDSWWRGLVYLHDVHDGMYDPEFISLDRIKREYS